MLIIKEDILTVGKGPSQGLDDTTLTTESEYSNVTEDGNKFYLSLYYNGSNGYLFVNGAKICQFKAKYSELIAYPLRLVNISEDFTDDNMKETRLNGYVYDIQSIIIVLVSMIF